MDRSSSQNIHKEARLKWYLRWDGSHCYLQDIPSECRRIQLFLSANGTFSRINHILSHKSNLSKFKKIEIISSIFSDHNAMRLDINYKKKTVWNINTWRLKTTFLNNQKLTEDIKREIKKISRNKWQWKHDNSKPMGCSLSNSNREAYSNTIQTRKTSNRQPNFTPKTTGKRRTREPQN